MKEQAISFRQQMASKADHKRLSKQLYNARLLIQDLDTHEGVEKNPFWLPQDNVLHLFRQILECP